MSVDAECQHASREAVCCFDPTSTGAQPAATSRALCNVMLGVLGRDNKLRSMYVRQRWQGFVEETDIASSQAPNNARKCR